MGHGFEARLEKNLLFRAHRHEYDIRGKSKLNPKHPLQGDKTTKEGKRIPINADHSIYSYPDLDIEVDTDNHKISLSGTIDKSEQGKISSIIVKKYSVNWKIKELIYHRTI